MKRDFLARILALFLTLAMGLSLPAPAHALRPLNAGLEEGNPVTQELEARLLADQPAPTAGLEEEWDFGERERYLAEQIRLQGQFEVTLGPRGG